MGGLHKCSHLRPLTLSPATLQSAEPSPELVRERVGGMCVWSRESPLLNPPTTPFTAHVTGGDSTSWVDTVWDVITGATGAACPVLRVGKWHCESGRAGKRCPRLPPAYAALPDHRRPPLGSWRWARQLESLPLLRWWQPAFVALPKMDKKITLMQPLTFFPPIEIAYKVLNAQVL